MRRYRYVESLSVIDTCGIGGAGDSRFITFKFAQMLPSLSHSFSASIPILDRSPEKGTCFVGPKASQEKNVTVAFGL